MSEYLYHPRSKDLYQQSLKALTCPHTRLVWGMVAKRTATNETWLAKHIEKCEQCRLELNRALEEEKFLAEHIPFEPISAEFSSGRSPTVKIDPFSA